MACPDHGGHGGPGWDEDHPGMQPARSESIQAGASIDGGKLRLPPVLFGTSALGNLYREIPEARKAGIVDACRSATLGTAVFDGAGKYGAGMALEVLGRSLRGASVGADEVLISNKL